MIGLDYARSLLRAAVRTRGEDFVYNPYAGYRCMYRPLSPEEARVERPATAWGQLDDPRCTTGCLIGVALDIAGETRHHDNVGAVVSLVADYPDMMTREAADYFAEAQWAQDHASTWGQAYAAAERWYAHQRLEMFHDLIADNIGG
jgi:hypothetical protein